MADAAALLALAGQYSLVFLIISVYFRPGFRLEIAVLLFAVLAVIAVVIWHSLKKKTAGAWGMFALYSVVFGILFFGADWFETFIQRQPSPLYMSGLLGLPLTILVCPVGTMVCVAGVVRALYLRRTECV